MCSRPSLNVSEAAELLKLSQREFFIEAWNEIHQIGASYTQQSKIMNDYDTFLTTHEIPNYVKLYLTYLGALRVEQHARLGPSPQEFGSFP